MPQPQLTQKQLHVMAQYSGYLWRFPPVWVDSDGVPVHGNTPNTSSINGYAIFEWNAAAGQWFLVEGENHCKNGAVPDSPVNASGEMPDGLQIMKPCVLL